MIVSGGKILGIHKVEHDLTFSGDGVRTPIGLDHGLLEEIHETSAKLEKSEFDSWAAQTEHWDVSKYTGGDGIKIDDHEISVSAKYLTSGDLNPYATSSWVEDNFLNKADYREYSEGNDYVRIDDHKIYGYDWTSAVSGVPFKLDTSAFEQYSGWANGTYLKEEALNPYVTSDDLEPYAKTQLVQEALDKKQDVSAMSAYATSAWVDGNFQTKDDYITPAELETALAPYATSDRVNEGLAKKVDVTAMSAYATSAWVEENFSKQAVRVSYDAQSEELHLDFSPLPIVDPDIVLLQDWMTYDIGVQLSSGTIPTVEFDADGPLDVTGTGWSGTPYINQASLGKVNLTNWTENRSENLKYNLENLLDLSQDWTFECWIKQSNTGYEDSYNMPSYMTLHKTSGNMSIFGSFKNLISCIGRDMEYSGIKSDTTNWHHICVIRYSGTNKLYVDGTLRATNTSVTFSNDLLHFIILPRLWVQYSVSDYDYRYLTRIAQVCLTKRAKWTDNFTPPTKPYCLGTPRTQVTE